MVCMTNQEDITRKMELQYLANNIVSNFLILLFSESNFFSKLQLFLQTYFNILTTKWYHFWKISDHQNPCKSTQITSDEGGERISTAEMNLMMNRLEMYSCRFEGNAGFSAQDLSALFEEEEPSLDEIKEAFKVFDVNNDGFIDASELNRVVSSLGLKERYGLEECKKMIIALHHGGNGNEVIDFQMFVKFMDKCLS